MLYLILNALLHCGFWGWPTRSFQDPWGEKKRNYFHFIKKWKKKVYFLKLVKKNSVHELDKIRFICFHILKHL